MTLLVLLDVYGSLFRAPSFTWPPNTGSARGIRFYAALTDPAIHILIGQWDMAEFGWK